MKSLKVRIAALALAGGFGAAAIMIDHWEGNELTPYQDAVGVWTVCRGHTSTVDKTRTYTPQECDALFQSDLGNAFSAIDRHVIVPVSEPVKAALASFIFNVGETQFRNSTLLRKLNAGDTAGACAELDRWVYAKGRKLSGLVKRRAAERELCEAGL